MTQESKFVLELSEKLYSYGLTQDQISEVCKQASVATLSKQQRQIYEELPNRKFMAVDAKYLSYATGLDTKNISSQIKQIQEKTNLVGVDKSGKKFRYFKY